MSFLKTVLEDAFGLESCDFEPPGYQEIVMPQHEHSLRLLHSEHCCIMTGMVR
jgi:hypothetical protein